jgi:hypothetical protein
MGGRIAGQMANQQPEHCSHAFISALGRARSAEDFSAAARFLAGGNMAAWRVLKDGGPSL